MSSLTEKKYVSLRKRLDHLGYRQALGLESLPLVERLFSDLLHTTDSLKKAKLSGIQSSVRGTDSSQLLEDAIGPYKTDNARLVQENNNLHLEMVRSKEELESKLRSLKSTVHRLEHENADLKFLNSQYVHKVKAVERESASKTNTIQKLQEKNLQAVIQTPGGKKRSIPFRRQRMQIDSTLPQSETSSYISSQPNDPYVADLVQVADTKIKQMTDEVTGLQQSREINLNKIKNLRQQVESRDREIDRLNRSLEGGRPHDVVSLEARNKSNERLISHLNLQVDYLQQTNQELEDRIRELDDGKSLAVAENHKLRSDVDRLHDELRDIDKLAQQLEQEKQEAVVAADREIQEAQIQLRSTQRQEESAENRLMNAHAARDRLMTENEDLQSDLCAAKADNERLNGLFDKVQTDKRIMSDKLQTMSAKEKSLVLELEQYRTSPSRARKMDKSPSKLDCFVRSLEQERDHYKDECEVLQNMIREHRAGRSRSTSPKGRSPGGSPHKTPRDRSESYQQLIKERDELQLMLNKFERHMAEIQSNVKVLTQERDKTNLLYEQTNEELQRLRRECVRSPKSPKASLTAQAILRRVETERDNLIGDLRRMTTERDSLRERLKVQQEQYINERSRLDQRVDDLENKSRALAQERVDMQSRVDSLKDVNLALEDDVKALRLKIQQIEDDYYVAQNELDDARTLRSQLEATLENTQRNLSRKTNDLTTTEDRIRTLEIRIDELLDDATKQSEDAANLRATTTSLDREKDALQAALDERTERAAALDDQLTRREREISDMRVSLSDLEAKLDRAGDDLVSSEREVRSLRRQLDSAQTDLNDNSRSKDTALRENRRLQDDLATLTRENQDINIELDNAMRDKNELKRQVEDNLLRVSSLDGNMASKERELQDVLDQYRKVASERDAAESRYRVSCDEAATLRSELMASDAERHRCVERIASLEKEVSDLIRTHQSYEAQISNVTSTAVNMEGDLERIRADRLSLQEDLQSVRDLNAKLDSNKEHIARQLAASNVENEQLRANLEDINRELEILHKHLDTERAGSKNLEDLIAGAREKEFQAQLNAQEQKSEGQLLRDKLALNESKMQSMTREVTSLRERTSQLDSELELTKRHLTNERYERERAVQELRRNGLPSPGLSRLSRPLSPTGCPRSGSPSRMSFLDDGR